MKSYTDYMDGISVEPELHNTIMRRVKQNPAHRNRAVFRYAGLAACAAVLLLCVWTIPGLFSTPNVNPSVNPGGIIADTGVPSDANTVIPGLPDEVWGTVYHTIDVSRINRRGTTAKVPADFWFANRLVRGANNSDVRRDSGSFTKEDIETALRTSLNDPILPDGDCAIERNTLIDNTNGKIIAYITTYVFFSIETMEFQRSYSVFYFALDDFMRRGLEQSENIVYENGKTVINDFDPVIFAHAKMPHVRRLVYIENGVAVAVEAETEATLIGDTVDEANSLERYGQSDRELISIMQSLIGY